MYYDLETQNCINYASELPEAALSLWPEVRRLVMDRCASFESGLLHVPMWAKRRLREIDPALQLRWDFNLMCYVVDRFVSEQRAFVPVCIWRENGQAKQLDENLFLTLEEADMWRFRTPLEYLEFKRARAKQKREQNDKRSTEKILEAVDNLSSREIQEFIDVERAIHTGETITAHGSDLKTLERMHEGGLRARAQGIAAPSPRMAMNPGMHPKLYCRQTPLEERLKEGV